MLLLTIGEVEQYDSEKNEFIPPHPFTLKLEHSLLSISKWEAIWKKPFLHMRDEKTGEDTKTKEQTMSYVKCMTLNQNVPDDIYDLIGPYDMRKINDYINQEQTATWFTEPKGKNGDRTIVTSELIYYWLVAHQIPWEAQKWHLSRLYTLIQICNIKSDTKKKMSKTDLMSRNRNLNAARRAANQSKG